MQHHESAFVVEASPSEVWSLSFGSISTERSPDPFVIEMESVPIDILHPGDAIHEGPVRHCLYPVPRYLLSGGIAESWELVPDVAPDQSDRYLAITKPPFAVAEAGQWLEDLRDGRTRVHFSERYEIAKPWLRPILERPVHRMISTNNDQVIEHGIRIGVEALRASTS